VLRPRPVTVAVSLVLALGALAGCRDGSASPKASPTAGEALCDGVAREVLATTQRYVDGFAIDQPQPSGAPSTPATPKPTASAAALTPAQYSADLADARRRLTAAGCNDGSFRDALAVGLPGLRPRGAIATAVLAQLRVSLTGQLPPQPVTRRVTPSDNLTDVLAALPDSSTVDLAAGTYQLTSSLVLLRPITLRGAGETQTILTSTAADAAVLVMTDQPVTVERMSLRRTGAATGSVVVTGPSARLAMRTVHVSGARAEANGGGGVGVLLTAGAAGAASSTATFTATDSAFSDNAAAGVAVGGTHRASIAGSRFEHNGTCGVCFLGSTAGSVTHSLFAGNAVGLAAGSASRPLLRDNRISGGDVGIQAAGTSQPTISHNVISSVARAAMVFIDDAAGTVDGNNCSGSNVGIAVTRTAYPYVGHNSCRVTLSPA
jgi:parallel beta-helix repeat protein